MWLALDELDYMAENDFDTISALCLERSDIGMVCSSTPTGARSKFYQICTIPSMGFSQHYHPSTHNPNYTKQMDDEYRAGSSENGYVHEVLAQFGSEETGVFNKNSLDCCIKIDNYSYRELTNYQRDVAIANGSIPDMYIPPKDGRFKSNVFRTVGVKNIY